MYRLQFKVQLVMEKIFICSSNSSQLFKMNGLEVFPYLSIIVSWYILARSHSQMTFISHNLKFNQGIRANKMHVSGLVQLHYNRKKKRIL